MTTYSDAVNRARAAYAIGMNKKAEGDAAQNNAWNSNVMAQEMMDWDSKYKADRNRAASKAEADAAGERNLASGKEYADFIRKARTLGRSGGMDMDTAERIMLMAQNGGLPDDLKEFVPLARNLIAGNYTGKMGDVVNRAQGEEASRKAEAANTYLKEQVPQNIFDAQVLKKLQLGIPLSPEEQQRGLELQSQITAQTADENQKGIDAVVADNTAKRNLGISAGAGLLGGAAVGAGAYGLAGLFPSLRKRRLLRALIALSAGGAAGAGIGYGVNKGLNSGKLG